MYVCLCKGLTETDVQLIAQDSSLVQGNGLSPDRFISALRLDDDECCGRCARNIQELIAIASNATCGPCQTS
jgi:bacterioferritin-associated ferredoxin